MAEVALPGWRWDIRWRFGGGDGWACGYCSQPAPGRRCAACGRDFWWQRGR